MYTAGKINDLVRKASELNLEGAALLGEFTVLELTDIANGIGASWMPEWSRALVTGLHPSLEAAALIHDLHYHAGGDPEARRLVDKSFLRNCGISARSAYGWWDPRRYAALRSAKRFYRLLRLFGGMAWRESSGNE